MSGSMPKTSRCGTATVSPAWPAWSQLVSPRRVTARSWALTSASVKWHPSGSHFCRISCPEASAGSSGSFATCIRGSKPRFVKSSNGRAAAVPRALSWYTSRSTSKPWFPPACAPSLGNRFRTRSEPNWRGWWRVAFQRRSASWPTPRTIFWRIGGSPLNMGSILRPRTRWNGSIWTSAAGVVGTFPNPAAALRLAGAVLIEYRDESGRVSPPVLQSNVHGQTATRRGRAGQITSKRQITR